MAGKPDIWPPGLDREELTVIDEEGFLHHEFVNPLLIDDALDMVREAVRGNGLSPDAVQFTGFEGGVVPFAATMIFRATPEISRKVMAGKQAGEIAGTETAAREKIAAQAKALCAEPKTRDFIAAKLRQRRNIGFAEDGFALLVDEAGGRFVIQESCTTCSGQGSAPCKVCHGTAILPCRRCHGQSAITCPTCGGGHTVTRNGQRQTCPACRGQGRMRCPACRGKGKVSCQACRGKGRSECKACQGSGWRSVVLTARLRLKGRFTQDPALPPSLLTVFKDLGGTLVAEQHIDVAIAETAPAGLEIRDDEIAVAYDGRAPWGEMGFMLGVQALSATLFGFRPALLAAPPFLEQAAGAGIEKLALAAGRRRDAAALLHDAAEYRLVAEALRAVARLPAGAARRRFETLYPIGLTEEAERRILAAARGALAHVGRLGRIAGLVAGFLVMTEIDRLARNVRMPALHAVRPGMPNILTFAAPVLLILCGSFVLTLLAGEGERFFLHRALPKLDLRTRRTLLPRLDSKAAVALAASTLAWLAAQILGGGLTYLWPVR